MKKSIFLLVFAAAVVGLMEPAQAGPGNSVIGGAGPRVGNLPWGTGTGQAPIPGYILIGAQNGLRFLVKVSPYVLGAVAFIAVTQYAKAKIETPAMITQQQLEAKMNTCFRNSVPRGKRGRPMAAMDPVVKAATDECIYGVAKAEGLVVQSR